jgi:dTDP-4-amino-4,6-dideoxygalactose transaminase
VHDHKKARELKSGGKEQGWIPWFVDIFVKKAPSSMRSKTNVEVRAALKAYLKSQGLGSREVYPPLHTQGCYPEWHGEGGKFPVCMQYCPVGLWLPSSTAITDPQIERVCNDVNAFFAGRARL